MATTTLSKEKPSSIKERNWRQTDTSWKLCRPESKNGKSTENGRWLESYGDCVRRFALTTAGFVYFSGSQSGMILSLLPLRGHLTMRGDTFGCHNWGQDYWHLVWIEARDVLYTDYNAQIVPSTPTKNDLTQNVTSANVGKPWCILRDSRACFVYTWEDNPVSLLEHQCNLFICLKKVMLTIGVSDTLSSTDSGIIAIHRLGKQATSTYPESSDEAHSPLFLTASCQVTIATESSQWRSQ